MKIKVSELKGPDLDYWVAKALKEVAHIGPNGKCYTFEGKFSPSTNWEQGGEIIEQYGITTIRCDDDYGVDAEGYCNNERIPVWAAEIGHQGAHWIRELEDNVYWFEEKTAIYGLTPLIAAMRCFVTYKFGPEVGDD